MNLLITDYPQYCPYCKADLSLYSDWYGWVACPFCNKKIYAAHNTRFGGMTFYTFDPYKLVLIAFGGAILLLAILLAIFMILHPRAN